MILSSRPLRFLGVVIGGWVGARAAILWPVAQAVAGPIHAAAPSAVAAVPPLVVAPVAMRREPVALATAASVRRTVTPIAARSSAGPTVTERPAVLVYALTPAAYTVLDLAPASLPGIAPPPTFRTSRWSGSAWAILRPAGHATPFASQLGGSQAGARIAYAVDGARRVAVYARASTAVDSAQREAAVGLDWRPTRFPVHLVAEQRIGIEGVRGGTALGAIGGFGPTRVAGPVRAEAYAQAGVIFRDGREGFADGSLRVTMPVVPRVDLGLGAWGGVQKGASRVDVGPTLGVTLPVERHALRLSVDWRQRVAGDARPGSGPALSAGVDF